MKVLIILSDAPYGSERTYNGLRLAGALAKQEGVELKVFLIGDAAASGYYNVQTMLGAVTRRGASVGVCGTCMDARGVTDAELAEGTHRSSMDELTSWTVEADKAITF